MKLLILNSAIKYITKKDETVLTEKDFHPCQPFFIEHSLQPESIKFIKTKGVFETTRYIRHILKVIDALLEVDGEIQIEFYRASFDGGGFPLRPLNFLMNEISVCYKERYKIYKKQFIDNVDYIWLKKIKPTLPVNDSIKRWSFGIVSNGRKNKRVINLINQIVSFKIPEFEILICGPAPPEQLPKEVTILDDSDLYFDIRIPISKKKNRIIDYAKYNNLVIMHDRISFGKDWYKRISSYGNYFDQLCMPILDEDTQSMRVNDWLTTSSDFTLFRKTGTKLDYKEWDRHIFVDGGFMLLKKHNLQNIKLNQYLNWGEMEDVDLSERLYLDGNLINFFFHPYLLSQTDRHKVKQKSTNWIKVILRPIRRKQYFFTRNRFVMIKFRQFLRNNLHVDIQK